MKKRLISTIIAGMTITALLAGCSSTGNSGTENQPAAEESQDVNGAETQAAQDEADAQAGKEAVSETEEAEEAAKTEEVVEADTTGETTSDSASIPSYEYPGPELFYSVLYQYLIDEYAKDYPEAQVSIPCPVIIQEDESDQSDIRVYGNFWIFNYDLKDGILENTSGGSYPGCIHVKSTDSGYEVTSMDVVADGSDFTESAKEIFGDYYDIFMKDGEDEKLREELRAQIIANYVAANNLEINAFRDYGQDPVTLPEENIDSFYSDL